MKICTPIQEKAQNVTLKRLKALESKVDLAEVWLDQIKDLDLKSLIKKAPLPLVLVCKKPSEKGAFRGSDADLAVILQDSCKFGARYVDIPFNMPKNLNKKVIATCKKSQITNHKSQIIISHHDFKKTPSLNWMLKTAHEMKKKGADLHAGACIVKIAVTARSLEDTFTVISLAQILQAEKIPHILIAMGKKGILTRIITPFLGGTIMFAPIKTSKSTASGQLTVAELKKAWSLIGK